MDGWLPRISDPGGSVPDGARLRPLHKGGWLHPREGYFTEEQGRKAPVWEVGPGKIHATMKGGVGVKDGGVSVQLLLFFPGYFYFLMVGDTTQDAYSK